MTEVKPQVKKNAFMELFSKRQPDPIAQNKPTKKVKTNENKQDDALYKILSWRDGYVEYALPKQGTYKIVKQDSISKGTQAKWAENVQGILINIDWEATSFEQLNELNLSSQLIHNGIVFIWGNKTNIGAMMDYFQKMNFFYVQNFMFVLLNRNKIPERSEKTINGNKSILNFFKVNKPDPPVQNSIKKTEKIEKDYQIGKVDKVNTIFCNQDSQYFKQTQKVLYMFRKVSKNQPLQLRHQRTSDVYFTIGNSLKLDWKSKQIVYKMIETLLINANYKQKQGFKLVELWGDETKPRKGWVTVVEQGLKKDDSSYDNSQQGNDDKENQQI